jgi:hypothetical protein
MSRAARRAPALLPSRGRLNWRVRSSDNREAAVQRLSWGCHIKLTVGKFTSLAVDQAAIDGELRGRSRAEAIRSSDRR